LHADIITGRDSRIDIDDIYNGPEFVHAKLIVDYDLANVPFHTEIEKRLRI